MYRVFPASAAVNFRPAIFLILLLALCFGHARAQGIETERAPASVGPSLPVPAQITWQQYDGPDGGLIGTLCVTESGALLASAGADLYRSSNNGVLWASASQGIVPGWNGIGVTSLLRGGTGEVLLVSNGRLYRSLSDGSTWQHVSTPAEDVIRSVCRNIRGMLFIGDTAHVFRSTNNGGTWTQLADPLARTGDLLATRSGRIISIDGMDGYVTSTDDGATWTKRPWPYFACYPLSMDSTGALYASGSLPTFQNSTMRSTDDGTTWTPIGPQLFTWITPGPGGMLYGIGDKLYASTSQGNTWTTVKTVDLYREAAFSCIAPNANGDLFLGTWFGVEALMKNTANWVPAQGGIHGHTIQSMAKDSAGSILARNYWGWAVHLSGDNGRNWASSSANYYESIGGTQGLVVLPSHSWVLSFSSRIYRSSDNGASWTWSNIPFYIYNGGPLCSAAGGLLLGADSSVYRSMDEGRNWTNSGAGLPAETKVNRFSTLPNGEVLLATERSVFRLPPSASAWVPVDSAGLPHQGVASVVSNATGELFAVLSAAGRRNNGSGGSWYGVYRKLAAGGPWQRVSPSATDTLVTCVALHRGTGQLFAGTQRGGIYYSSDNGTTWQNNSAGYPSGVAINSLDFLGDSVLAVSSAGAGAFHSSFPVPVELLAFGANKITDGVVLFWRTAMERENAGFRVQRVTKGGENWNDIAFVPSRSDAGAGASYSSFDPLTDPARFPARYRLVQLNTDGTSTLSPEVSVDWNEALPAGAQLDVYPNPVHDNAVLRVTLPSEAQVSLTLFDAAGRALHTLPAHPLPAGSSMLRVSLTGVPAGSYFWMLNGASETRVVRRMTVR